MTTMGADKTAGSITVNTVEIQPGESVVAWYNRITKFFQESNFEFKDLPPDVKKYMLYGPPSIATDVPKIPIKFGDCNKEAFDALKLPKIRKDLVQIDKPHLPDQSIKADAGKAELRLVPMAIMYAIASIRTYGNKKYSDPDSWKRVAPERYIDAMLRHATAFAEDPLSKDEESGLPHLHHLACNIAFLCHMFKEKLEEHDE